MRILILNFRDLAHATAGGAEVFTEEIGKRLVQFGNDVTIFSSAFDGCEPVSYRSGIRIVRKGGKYSVYRKARKFLKENFSQFDLVVDEINTVPFQAYKVAKGKPLVTLIHQLAREIWYHETWFPLNVIGYHALESFWLRRYREIPTITVSESTKSDLLQLGFKDVHIIRNGIGAEPLREPPVKPDRPILIFVGRMVSSKQPDHALKAYLMVKERFPEAELWVLGDGYLRSRLQREGADGVRFFGHVSGEEKFELLRQAHIMLSPSVREGWGVSVIEANAMATPAIGYAVPGLRDSIIDGTTGFLVQPNNPSGLAKAACQVLADADLRRKLSLGALDWARHFNWDSSATEFNSLILSISKR